LSQTGIRGKKLRQDKLSFYDFNIHQDEDDLPTQVTRPYGQIAPIEVGSQKKGYVARFLVSICETCSFHQARKCPSRFRKRKQFYGLYFRRSKMRLAHGENVASSSKKPNRIHALQLKPRFGQ